MAALSCTSQCLRKCLRTFLGASSSSSFAHGSSLGFPSLARSFHRRSSCFASPDAYRCLYNNGSICGGSICCGYHHNLSSSGFVKWKLMRSRRSSPGPLLFCSLQNSQALSMGSSEPLEMLPPPPPPLPAAVESNNNNNMDSSSLHYQILRDELEAKKRELEAKILENNSLRNALRDAQEGRKPVTEDVLPLPVEAAKDRVKDVLTFSSEKKASTNAEILENPELLSGSQKLEGTDMAQGGRNVIVGSVVEIPEAIKETLEEKDVVETLQIATALAQDHPWPEWRSFLEQLEADHFFDFDTTIESSKASAEDEELGQDARRIKRAAMGFARQRNDILRALSRKNLQTVAQFGCPSTDRKAVNAAKRLRAFLQIDEALACEPCELRTACVRAYSLPTSHETTTTTDIIRVLVGYASVVGAYKRNLPEDIEAAARSLMIEVVTLAKLPFDLSMTLPVSKKPEGDSRKLMIDGSRSGGRLMTLDDVKSKRRAVGEADMKPGDWQCPECDYVNFQRNSECRECNATRPLADLRPGDWQCTECKFINFAKNRQCRKCNSSRVITQELREGDWICPKCKFHNFSKNQECFDCQTERPRSSGRGDDRGRGGFSRSSFAGKEERQGRPGRFDAPQRRDQISSPNRHSKHEEWKPDFKKKAASPNWDDIEADDFTDDELVSDSDDDFSFDEDVVAFSDDDDDDENDSDFRPRSSSAKRGGRGARAGKATNRSLVGCGTGGDEGQSRRWLEDFDANQNGRRFGNDSSSARESRYGDNGKEDGFDDFDDRSPSPRRLPAAAGRGRNSGGDRDRGRSSWEGRDSRSGDQSSRGGRGGGARGGGGRGRRGGRGR